MWPTGPTKPKPNMLVIPTRFQLILNSSTASDYKKESVQLQYKSTMQQLLKVKTRDS